MLGKLIYSFHSSEIDYLIDSFKSHDSSRYDADVLKKAVKLKENLWWGPGFITNALMKFIRE